MLLLFGVLTVDVAVLLLAFEDVLDELVAMLVVVILVEWLLLLLTDVDDDFASLEAAEVAPMALEEVLNVKDDDADDDEDVVADDSKACCLLNELMAAFEPFVSCCC